MRVCTCATCPTCVAIAAVLLLPPTDHRSHQPHAHNPSPSEQVATPGNFTVASSTSSAVSSARGIVHRLRTSTSEATDATHPS